MTSETCFLCVSGYLARILFYIFILKKVKVTEPWKIKSMSSETSFLDVFRYYDIFFFLAFNFEQLSQGYQKQLHNV